VVADAHLAEAHLPQRLLGRLHLSQSSRRHGDAVRETGGEAGRCRLIPGGEPHLPGPAADFPFGDSRLEQRGADAVLPGRHRAGPMVTHVVRIGAVEHRAQPPLSGHRPEAVPQLRLAEVAPVGGVGRVPGIGELFGIHLEPGDVEATCHLPG